MVSAKDGTRVTCFLLLVTFIAIAQDPCSDPSPGSCEAWPPGHSFIGQSSLAIGYSSAVKTDICIERLVTLLTVPPVPDAPGIQAINPALENTNTTDLGDSSLPKYTFQTLLTRYPSTVCNQSQDQWCFFASEYDNQWLGSPQLWEGDTGDAVSAGEVVNVTYVYSPENGTVSQYPSSKWGGASFTDTVPDFIPRQWWAKTECKCQSSGYISQHTYSHTSITLNKADPHFGASLHAFQANYTDPYTSDGGRTWYIDKITIQDSYCENNTPCDQGGS